MKTKSMGIATCISLFVFLGSQFGLAQTLNIYSMYNPGEPMVAVTEQVAKDFEEATGAKVKITWAGRDVLTKARPLILMGNPPDLVYQSTSELYGALLSSDEPQALPITDILQGPGLGGEEHLIDVLPKGVLDFWVLDGEQYMLPEQFITSGFFYNKSVFEEYGISVPKTWEELMDAAATLKENGVAPFMQDAIGEYTAFWPYWAIVREVGPGKLLAAASDPTGATWDDPAYLEAIQKVEEVSAAGKNYFQEGYEGSTWPAAQGSWAQGNGAMILVGSWIVNEVARSAAPSWKPGFFPFPEINPDVPETLEARMNGWAIPAGAKNPDLAKEFLKFLIQKKYQEMVVSEALITASRADVAYPEGLKDMREYVEQAPGFNPVYDGTQAQLPEWYSTLFEPLSIRLVQGNVTAEEFIQQIKQDTIDYWGRQQ